MSTESEPSTTAAQATPSEPPRAPKKKKKKGTKAKIVQPLEEHEINAPDKQTLFMLGSLATLGIVLWIFAHAGCNYHPPRETRRPRAVTTADLTRDPKDAAIEFQQRLLTQDFKGALEIAGGPLSKQIQDQQAACAADRARCEAAKQASTGAMTMAVVLEREPMNAKVRVITHRVPDGPRRFLTLVERDGTAWKITARVPDAPGAKLPPPSLATGIQFAPAPGASPLPPGHP
ncbi:MAG TPA: hypothetical protein VIM73_17095 [Polyangiaceae bacterium]